MPIRIAIIGYGKIAEDQHLPAICSNRGFQLAAVVGPHLVEGPGVPAFCDLHSLLAAIPVDAVAICTPPGPRHAIAVGCLAAGLHVLVEKPPTATFGEAEDLRRKAESANRTLFTAWHAQHNAAVATARALLADAKVARLRIDWREDVRKWHPDQEWIWAPGGFGVFDPGINALSIANRILPEPLLVQSARLVFPANRQAPIAAKLRFYGSDHSAGLDWRETGGECWTIEVDTAEGRRLKLLDGGVRLEIDGVAQQTPSVGEYSAIYARFAELVAAGRSDVDTEPLRIVADAFLIGARETLEPFA